MVAYNKNKKGDRVLYSGGPRDHQRRLRDLDSRLKIPDNLQRAVSSPDSGYSKEDIEQLINKTLEDVSLDLESRYKQQIEEYKSTISGLEKTIKDKDDQINKLSDKLDVKDNFILNLSNKIADLSSNPARIIYKDVHNSDEDVSEDKDDRPDIDRVFIDPTIKGSEDKLKSHVINNEVTSKNNVQDSVGRLKDLVGKLPKI